MLPISANADWSTAAAIAAWVDGSSDGWADADVALFGVGPYSLAQRTRPPTAVPRDPSRTVAVARGEGSFTPTQPHGRSAVVGGVLDMDRMDSQLLDVAAWSQDGQDIFVDALLRHKVRRP